MTFRYPLAFILGAALTFGCSGPKTTADDTDVDTDDTTVVDTDDTTTTDTDVDTNDTDVPAECDNASDTDTTITCFECVACEAPKSCPDELAACNANADCAALYQCVINSADSDAYDLCAEGHDAGNTLLGPLQACTATECPNSCD